MNELKIKEAQKKALRKAKAEVARLNDLLIAARFWHDVAESGILSPEPIEQPKAYKRVKCMVKDRSKKMVETSERILSRYLRPELATLLAQCTESQQRKFVRIFGSVEEMNPKKIADAIALCERTIKNNEEQKD